MAGPEVVRTVAFISAPRMWARVVLPRPGGPLRRRWSRGWERARAESRRMLRRSLSLGWPVKSARREGRSDWSMASLGWAFSFSRGGTAIRKRMAKVGRFESGKVVGYVRRE